MSGKTLFVIVVTMVVTLILVNNTDDMELWLFGVSRIPKLAVLGTVLGIGFILGFVAGRPAKRKETEPYGQVPSSQEPYLKDPKSEMSDEDREYIS